MARHMIYIHYTLGLSDYILAKMDDDDDDDDEEEEEGDDGW